MQCYELTVPSRPEVLPLIVSLVERGAIDAGLPPNEAIEIAKGTEGAIETIQKSLARDGDSALPISVAAKYDTDQFIVEILERGRPIADGSASDPLVASKYRDRLSHLFDTIYWHQVVPIGSELRLHRRIRPDAIQTALHATPVDPREAIPQLEPAPTQDYEIRRFEPRDAIQIAQSIYEAYGHTYLDPDLYDPDRITELNRSGKLHSVVALAEDGHVVGHYALERPNRERATESGQAVVDRAHRGRHLLDRMHEELIDWARELCLPGFYGRSTARHCASQKMNERFGAIPVGLLLAYSPASMRLRHNRAAGSGDRPSSVLYWTPLRRVGGNCHLPPRLAPIAEPILRSLGFENIHVGQSAAPKTTSCSSTPAIRSQASPQLGLASLLIEEVSAASAPALAQCCTDLLGLEKIASIVLHVPLDDPHTPWLADLALEDLGFNVAGVLPFDLPGQRHALVLERTLARIDTDGLALESDVGRKLLAAANLPPSRTARSTDSDREG